MGVTNLDIFRTRSSFVYAWTIYVTAFTISALTLSDGNWIKTMQTIAWAVVASLAAYLIFIRPKVLFFDEGISIVNPFNELTVGWHQVQSIDSRFSLSITTDGEVMHAWAAPAPSRYSARGIHPSELRGLPQSGQGSIRAAESPRSLSGAATIIARLRHENFLNNPGIQRISKEVIFNSQGVLLFLSSLIFALGSLLIQS